MSKYCSCHRFCKEHYPISRNGPNGTSGLAVILAPNNLVDDDVQSMRDFFQQRNLRTYTITDIRTLHRLKTFLDDLAQGRSNIQIHEGDSAFALSIVSRGDDKVTLLPDEHIICDEDVERYFDESHCPILRRKAKLHFYHKYWMDFDRNKSKITRLTPAFKDPIPPVITDLKSKWTTTSSNMISFYSFNYDAPLPRTYPPTSPILSYLPTAYQRYGINKDLVSFLTEFQNESSKYSEQVVPTLCVIGRDRLGAGLYFLEPLPSLEEQEYELYSIYQTIHISPPSTPHNPLRSPAYFSRKDHRSRPVYFEYPYSQ